jgi:hypothetical protein
MATTTLIGSKEDPYPMIENVWNFFSEKGTKLVFVSVGTGNSCLPDLDFAEMNGCPILKLDTPETSAKWNEVKDILKARKLQETTSEFAKPAMRKWVLPKNLHLQDCIPCSYNGTLVSDGVTLATRSWNDLLKEHCKTIGLEEPRLDVLKVDKCPLEVLVLTSVIQSGFRPSLLLVNWMTSPDSDVETLNTAAHLQMLGYALVGKEGSKYLYFYTDVNYYETCSWETVAKKFENPLLVNLVQSIYPGSEGVKIHFPVEKKDSE